jgi:hypothetical protein
MPKKNPDHPYPIGAATLCHGGSRRRGSFPPGRFYGGRLHVYGRRQIHIKKLETINWPDTSLGCPEPGKMYAQVITPGYRITVAGRGVEGTYHTDRQGNFVFCSQPS